MKKRNYDLRIPVCFPIKTGKTITEDMVDIFPQEVVKKLYALTKDIEKQKVYVMLSASTYEKLKVKYPRKVSIAVALLLSL